MFLGRDEYMLHIHFGGKYCSRPSIDTNSDMKREFSPDYCEISGNDVNP